MSKKQLKSLWSSAKMCKNGATPNKEALHGAFLLNKYILPFGSTKRNQTFPEAKNEHFDDSFRYGIMFPVSIGDAMFIRSGNSTEDKK